MEDDSILFACYKFRIETPICAVTNHLCFKSCNGKGQHNYTGIIGHEQFGYKIAMVGGERK